MPWRIPEHIIEQIRQQTDIVDLIQSSVPLKRAGANFRALCPFHKEKTPSFNVHPQKQIFHCFGCGVGGDVFRFVMLYENVDFMEAVRLLAKRAGITLEVQSGPEQESAARKEQLYRLHEEVCLFYQKILATDPRGEPARAYLKQRRVAESSIKTFRLGFAPDAWDAVLKWGSLKGFTTELMELAGLATRTEQGAIYDRFRGRLMFPICDEQGRVVAFSGRILDPQAKEAKYVNSPDTPIFKKGQVLYGLHVTKRSLLETRQVIVCEGQLDMIACFEAGVPNVVASQGTAFTERHGRLLKRYADEVVLTFDSDEAGQKAVARSIDVLLEAGLAVRVATLPAGYDPDSLVRKVGPQALLEVVRTARSFLDFYLEQLCRQFDPQSDRGRVEIVRRMTEVLAKIPSLAMSYQYVSATARRLQLPEAVIRTELRSALRARSRTMETEGGVGVESFLSSARKVSTADRELLHLMLAEPSLVTLVRQQLRPEDLPNGTAANLIRKILALADSGQWHGAESLQEELAAEEEGSLLSELLLVEPRYRDKSAAILACINSLHQDAVNAEREVIQQRLAAPNLSESELLALQKRLTELRQKPFDLRSQDKHITRLSPR